MDATLISGLAFESEVERLLAEDVISTTAAAKLFPRTREGTTKVHASTIIRFIRHGKGGIRLEGFRSCKEWFTTRQAVVRFLARLTAASLPRTARPDPEGERAWLKQQMEYFRRPHPRAPKPVPR